MYRYIRLTLRYVCPVVAAAGLLGVIFGPNPPWIWTAFMVLCAGTVGTVKYWKDT